MRPNDEVKKDIGCSPDQGLCYIYGIWGLRKVQMAKEVAAVTGGLKQEHSSYNNNVLTRGMRRMV
jgi:hypothetical protein